MQSLDATSDAEASAAASAAAAPATVAAAGDPSEEISRTAAAPSRTALAYEIAFTDATIDWDMQICGGTSGTMHPARVGDDMLLAKVITLKGEVEVKNLALVLAEADMQHQIADDSERVVRVRALAVKDNGEAGAAQQKQVAIFLEYMDRTLEEELQGIKATQGGPGAPAAGDAVEWRRRLSLALQVRSLPSAYPVLSPAFLVTLDGFTPTAGCGRARAAAPL